MAPPAGIRILGGGLGVAAADARYLRRFVSVAGVPIETARVRSQVNASAVTETVLENPNAAGVVQSIIPPNAVAVGFLENGDGARFGNRVKIGRIGVSPVVAGIRGEGSFAAPTPPLANLDLFIVSARPIVDGATGLAAVTASIGFRSRENLGPAAWGSAIRFSAAHPGFATQSLLFDVQGGGPTIAELVGLAATTRWIPLTTGQLRNPANTVSRVAWDATGLGFFNAAPIAQPTAVGARGGNAALASLLTQLANLGLIIDGTTP